MGSFNTTCALTRSIINSRTDVVLLLLTRKNAASTMPVHTWDVYAPVPVLFEGRYNSYGSLEDVKLFQSLPVMAEDERLAVEDAVLGDLQKRIGDEEKQPVGKKAKTLEDVLKTYGLGFVKDDQRLSMAKTLVDLEKQLKGDPKKLALFSENLLGILGFKTVDEAKTYVSEHKNDKQLVPIQFMMFRKDAFVAFLNQYGVGDKNKEHYAPKVQALRQAVMHGGSDESLEEMMNFLTDVGNYAGANRPSYTLDSLIEQTSKKDQKLATDLAVLSRLQGADITLLNDYFNGLGLIFQPTMMVNEDLSMYGHIEAFAMQKQLLDLCDPSAPKSPTP